MQCGATCLQMIAEYYGIKYSYSFIDEICHPTIDGVSLNAISQAAETIGFKPISGLLSVKSLTNNILPCILHWNQNHFVVLYKVKNNNSFFIADPSKGLLKYSIQELKEHWICTTSNNIEKGVALILEPTSVLLHQSNIYDTDKHSFHFLFRYLKQYKKYLLQILLGLLLGCVLQLILPFLTQGIVDLGIRHKDIGFIWLILQVHLLMC